TSPSWVKIGGPDGLIPFSGLPSIANMPAVSAHFGSGPQTDIARAIPYLGNCFASSWQPSLNSWPVGLRVRSFQVTMPTDTSRSNCLRRRAFDSLRLGENLNKEFGNSRFIRTSLSMRIGIPDKGRSGDRIPPPTERGSQDAGLANPASRAYTLAKTI